MLIRTHPALLAHRGQQFTFSAQERLRALAHQRGQGDRGAGRGVRWVCHEWHRQQGLLEGADGAIERAWGAPDHPFVGVVVLVEQWGDREVAAGGQVDQRQAHVPDVHFAVA